MAFRPPPRVLAIGSHRADVRRFHRKELRRERNPGRWCHEVFGPGNRYFDDGRFHAGQFPDHEDHIHAVPVA